MKIKVTYEETDLKQLIRLDLARQGIAATDTDIMLTKGKAEVSVEVTRDDASLTVEPEPQPQVLTSSGAMSAREYATQQPDPPPLPSPLQVVEGGNNLVDMSDVLGTSQRIARSGGGKFPVPERQLIDGESFDFPGEK